MLSRTIQGTNVPFFPLGFLVAIAMLVSTAASGQGIPGQSVNIIGPTPEIDYMLPDTGLKQQNEVNCTVRPGDPLVAFCGYNDYRTTEKTGDAWVGVSMTRDGGLTWSSRLAPGWPQYATPGSGAPIGHDFAADPNAAAIPGVVLYNFIATDRGKKGTGGLFLQRWFESDKENGFPYVPSQDTILITKGTSCPQCSGRFIDKPHMIAVLSPTGADVTVTGTMEDGTSRSTTVPAGELHVVYSVFTGSKQNGSKILHSVSRDWGATWSVDSKITESVEINQSAHLVARGNDLLVVWRRFSDNNESNALMYSMSRDRGQTWDKAEVLSELQCPYDQPTRNNMFRTTVHPVAATDGNRFYTFWSARGVEQTLGAGTDSAGNPIPAADMNCQFGLSRIVMSTSTDGVTWSTPAPVDMTSPGIGHQFMPSVASADGLLQVAWYDSRDSMLPVHNEGVMDGFFVGADGKELPPPFVARHSVDVRGKQIAGALNPLDPSVRLSRYPLFPLTSELSLQLGFNFVNARMFAGGKVPFMGDYISVAAPAFRLDADGNWRDNQGPGAFEPPSFYAAWTDNRDVRGDAWGDIFNASTVYSSNANIPPKATNDLEQGTETNYTPGTCVAGSNIDRTRDQNVYATTIKPGAVLTMPTRNKRLGALQRGYVVNVENAERKNGQEFTFCIDGQPDDYTGDVDMQGMASFNQFPAPISGFGLGSKIDPVTTLNVSVPAQSNSAQSVYVTSTIDFPHIPVSVYKGNFQCDGPRGELVSTIVINGDKLAADLRDPDADPEVISCTDDADPTCTRKDGDLQPIASYEVHDPEIINYIWALYNTSGTAPDGSVFSDAITINPLIMTRDGTANPLIMTRDVTNPLIMTRDGTSNPLIMTRDSTTNPLIMTRDSTTNPLIMTRDDATNPLIMTSGKTTNPLIMTKDGSTNPLIMTRDDVDNPLIMTRDGADNPLIMTRDQYDNPLIMTRNALSNPLIMTKDADGNVINPLIMTRDVETNPLIMTRDGAGNPLIMTYGGDAGRVALPASAFCTQQDIDANTCGLPDGYVEVTWLVENGGNTITAYNALPLIAGGSLVDADGNLIPTQLIVTKPYVTLATRGCETGWQVINQILLNTSNPFLENDDGTWSVDTGKATFFSGPGEEITITLRIFDTTFNPYRLGFAVQSQSCNSDELDCVIEPLAAIEVDTIPPGTPEITNGIPSPLDYLPAEGTEGAFAEWLATSTDDDGSSAAVSCVASFGDETVDVFFDKATATFSAVFPIGVINGDQSYTATVVTCTATDLTGNSSSADFEVLVLDDTPPVLIVPDVPPAEATSPTGATVDFVVTATDFGVPLAPETIVCTATDGTTTIDPVLSGVTVFSVGTWTVTCTATDHFGNPGSKSFSVIVKDETPPALVKPADIAGVEATSALGAPVNFDLPVATDAVGVTSLGCTPASGSTFGLGTTTVACTAGDAAGNSSSTGFDVTVVDTTAPALGATPTVPAAEASSASGAVVTYAAPTASDFFGAAVVCTPASGSTFALGDTTVTCTATDTNGNSALATFSVTVKDSTMPVVAPIANITKEATGPATTVTYATSAVDAVSGQVPVMCAPASGASFVVGASTVTCSATDGAGNTGSTSFSVTITDTTAPVVTAIANITREASGPTTAVTYTATATDLVSGSVPATCAPASGTGFVVGTTPVTCSATDAKGNTGTMSFSVIITDKTAPVFGSVPDITAFATSPAGATVNYTVTANDLVSGSVNATCTPASPHTFALGSSTVNCTAKDAAGNTSTTSFAVKVQYGSFIGMNLPNGMSGTGANNILDLGETAVGNYSRSIPLEWKYANTAGVAVNAESADPNARVERFGKKVDGSCDFQQASIDAQDSGNSSMRYAASSMTWKFSWKPSSGAGCYGVTIRSGLTGQSNGPYLFELR